MDYKPEPIEEPAQNDKPPGYQPTLGRKLFMLGLCVVSLIVVWVFYFLDR